MTALSPLSSRVGARFVKCRGVHPNRLHQLFLHLFPGHVHRRDVPLVVSCNSQLAVEMAMVVAEGSIVKVAARLISPFSRTQLTALQVKTNAPFGYFCGHAASASHTLTSSQDCRCLE